MVKKSSKTTTAMKSKYPILFSFSLAALVCSGALPVPAAFGRDDEKPRIVREAERRERERQNTQWTPENIRANPALFLQDMIAASDALKNKIEAQDIAFIRLKKQAARKVSEADSAIARYTKFLNEAKKQYKAAKENGNAFPVNVNGFELSEEELSEKVADALERIELSKKIARDKLGRREKSGDSARRFENEVAGTALDSAQARVAARAGENERSTRRNRLVHGSARRAQRYVVGNFRRSREALA